jgi:beta-lactamase class A
MDPARVPRPPGRPSPTLARIGAPRRTLTVGALVVGLLATPLSGPAAGARAPSVPSSPVGTQLRWFLGTTARLPLGATEISAHFDGQFLAAVTPAQLDEILGETPGGMRLVSISTAGPNALEAQVAVAGITLKVQMSVDGLGLIDGLRLTPVIGAPFTTWAAIDRQLKSLAPGVGLLAAQVGAKGQCTQRHALSPATPRPTGSMFKLFVLGALANAVRDHRVRWDQTLAITAANKVGGSGTLVNVPDGTKLTVQQIADLMISESDNTAADMLITLLGRPAIEAQVGRWSAHASLDVPFLSVSELFALKYADFPLLADHYLSLDRAQRAAYLTSTVDGVTTGQEQAAAEPRDINSIEWFAAPTDVCRAFSGLAQLAHAPGLSPVGGALSLNDGGVDLPRARWPSVWFKGGSESGVLTLGYRARDAGGRTFVVVAMIENPRAAFVEELVTTKLLDVVSSAFALLESRR